MNVETRVRALLARAASFGRATIEALVQPPLAGAAYVTALAIWAARTPPEDPAQLGAQAHQIEAVVEGRFGGEIGRIAAALIATAVVYGLLLGAVAEGLLALRRWLHPFSRRPRVVVRWLRVLAGVVVLQALLELWGMAADPQLYAAAWYAQGSWRRTVQVLASDVLHPGGIVAVAVVATVALLAGPRSVWHEWPGRVRHAAQTIQARGRRVPTTTAAASAVVLLLLLVLGRLPSAHAHADDARPNILILAADSLRADRLDPRIAPNLTALADQGTRFDRAYVSLPRTFPSWVTWLTGRHPHHHGIRSMFPRWDERAHDFDTVPERLARAGWATGVVSDYAGDIFSRIDLGFGAVDVPEFDFRQLVRQRVLERETPLLPLLHSRLGRLAFPVLREMNDAADPQMLAGDAVRTMRSMESRGPFFLVVFFSTAHFPYAAPSPYYRQFADPDYRGRFKYDKPVGLGQEAPADARDEQQVRGLYDGAVSAIDGAAQRILDALADDRIAGKTIVIVTGDHGETLYDHGHGQGHGDHLFGDEGTHVPLVIFDPRSPAQTPTPRRVPAIVRDVDLAPTVYALTGVTPPPDLDGRSLVPALSGKALAPALAYAETGLWFTEDIPGLPPELRLPYPGIARMTEVDIAHGDELVLRKEVRPLTIVAKHRMVRDDRYKLLYIPSRTGVRWMLYDTRQDPGETRDVTAAHPDVVARLQAELWTWMRQDPDMDDRHGYLVPRGDVSSAAPASGGNGDPGVVRLGDEFPPGQEGHSP
ncbi:MAG TPA: sulfatase [Polyangiaceae bacterium]|jgi:arylsulfatase A-like enzyme|nr:sulfatase [Polyangiaceae bacterium]